MHSDESQDSFFIGEWEKRLWAMTEIGRASKYEAFKDPLALLALTYLKRRDRLPMAHASDEPLSIARRLAEVIEKHSGSQEQPFSQSLLGGLSNIEPGVLADWLRIASENWPLEGFDEWFTAKLDELGFARHHDTPSSLSRLVASLFADRSPHTILDPACGTGGFLAAMAKEIGQAALFGQEMSSEACAWARLRFLVLGLRHIKLATGNALTDPAFTRLVPKQGFDLVLANPPFGMHLDPRTTSLLSRHSSHLTPVLSGRISSETAYVQVILESLSDSGVGAVIVPKGFLFRGGTDQRLREALVRNDVVQAIVGLPERLFAPGTTIESAILFLSRRKIDNQKERILFLDARKLGRREGVRVVLDDDSARRIRTGFTTWRDEPGFARVVSSSELDHASFSFSPARYIEPAAGPTTMSPDRRRSRIEELDAHYAELCGEYEAVRSRLALTLSIR
jgi:type I restriction enzyme M protein